MTQTFNDLEATLWQQIINKAAEGGLNPDRFDQNHRLVVQQIAEFLNQDSQSESKHGRSPRWRWFNHQEHQEEDTAVTPVPPIIISGVPGTGKTTFLYLIDVVLRTQFGLPDNIEPVMVKSDGTKFSLQKRYFCGMPISLLSVRKWTELLYFYNWDVAVHGFRSDVQALFIDQILLPMRIILADEVEMTGYSPTLPKLAQHGILVIGTSNQDAFAQLDSYLIPPRIYPFSGDDMRAGDPKDAIVRAEGKAWELFEAAQTQMTQWFDKLAYQRLDYDQTAVCLVRFRDAISAPMLESEWIKFFQETSLSADGARNNFEPKFAFVLLLDDFSMAELQGNFNAIIRFVTLFDVIEQFGIGVLIRNTRRTPKLSREAIQQMKISIKTRPGVEAEVKKRILTSIDRWTSRLGQAGHKARQLLIDD